MENVQLKDICSPRQWKTVSSSNLCDKGYPVYGANGIIGYYSDYNHKDETVLITCRGATCGSVNICKPYSYVNGNAMALDNLSKNVDLMYLYYFLKWRGFNDVVSGSAQPQIIRSTIGKIKVPICSMVSQQNIVKRIKQTEQVINRQKKQLNLLDELVKARFVEMFGDPINNPMEWRESTIGNECYYIKDGPHKSLNDIGKESGGHPFISVRNIVNGYIDFSSAKYISDADYEDAIKKCNPEKGDILYSKGGTTGIAKLIDIDERFANWVHLAVLKFDKEKLNGVFFENMLNSNYCYAQSQRLTKGIANRDLVLSAMAKIKIYIPPLTLQNQFADFVRETDKSRLVNIT